MQISSILDIIDGSLLNSPSISFIYSIKTNVSKVKEGDLFLARNLDEIQQAIKNGAFAIIIDTNTAIIDNEIAWIKVQDMDLCIVKLLRFKLAVKNLEAYHCDKITYNLLRLYSSSFTKNIKLIPNKLENLFKYIDEINDKDIIISSNENILSKIYPNNKNFNDIHKISMVENLIEHSLFETSFSYGNKFFSRIKLSSLYILNFLNVYKFLNENIDFLKLKSFNNFKPIFIDKNLNLIEFGKSDKFIICQNNIELCEDEILYIKAKYKYAKTIFISLSYINYLSENEQILINNLEELKPILRKLKFNAVYIIGFNHNVVSEYLLESEKHQTLF